MWWTNTCITTEINNAKSHNSVEDVLTAEHTYWDYFFWSMNTELLCSCWSQKSLRTSISFEYSRSRAHLLPVVNYLPFIRYLSSKWTFNTLNSGTVCLLRWSFVKVSWRYNNRFAREFYYCAAKAFISCLPFWKLANSDFPWHKL